MVVCDMGEKYSDGIVGGRSQRPLAGSGGGNQHGVCTIRLHTQKYIFLLEVPSKCRLLADCPAFVCTSANDAEAHFEVAEKTVDFSPKVGTFSKKAHDFWKKIVDFCEKAIPCRAKKGEGAMKKRGRSKNGSLFSRGRKERAEKREAAAEDFASSTDRRRPRGAETRKRAQRRRGEARRKRDQRTTFSTSASKCSTSMSRATIVPPASTSSVPGT